jgi:outer membrane lipoprotein-sorting protein
MGLPQHVHVTMIKVAAFSVMLPSFASGCVIVNPPYISYASGLSETDEAIQ